MPSEVHKFKNPDDRELVGYIQTGEWKAKVVSLSALPDNQETIIVKGENIVDADYLLLVRGPAMEREIAGGGEGRLIELMEDFRDMVDDYHVDNRSG